MAFLMSILPCTFLASALAIYVRQWQRKLAINFNISYIVCAFSAALLSTVDYGLFYTAIYAVCEWISEWREEWTREIEKEAEGSTRGQISEKQERARSGEIEEIERWDERRGKDWVWEDENELERRKNSERKEQETAKKSDVNGEKKEKYRMKRQRKSSKNDLNPNILDLKKLWSLLFT